MSESLNERKKRILIAVINDYITTATPVASKTISRKYKIDLSPATIRSVMSDLEEMGFLSHPHTSAGRIPTRSGFQFYVDRLIQVRNLSEREKEMIHRRCVEDPKDADELMQETSKILSSISNYAGLVLAPQKTKTVFKHIHFIRLREKRLLAVLVSKQGIVQNRILDVDEDISQEELDRIHNYLNSILSNLTIDQVRKRILKEMGEEKSTYDVLLNKALRLGHKTFTKSTDTPELFLDGEANLLEQPEFSDTNKLKTILRTLERKTLLMELLEKTQKAQGIQIFIGAEVIHPELKDLSLVAASYAGEEGVLGTLGVIGPTRMDYQRIIPLVDYTAKFLTKLLGEEK